MKNIAFVFLTIGLLLVGFTSGAIGHSSNTGKATIACNTKVSINFVDFPNKNGNTVANVVYVNGVATETDKFVFNGPTSPTETTNVTVGNGTYQDKASWNTNGVSGSYDSGSKVYTCQSTTTTVPAPVPGLTTTVTNTVTVTAPTVTVTVPAPTQTVTTTVTTPGVTVRIPSKPKVIVKVRVKKACPPPVHHKAKVKPKKVKKLTAKQKCLASPADIWVNGHCGIMARSG